MLHVSCSVMLTLTVLTYRSTQNLDQTFAMFVESPEIEFFPSGIRSNVYTDLKSLKNISVTVKAVSDALEEIEPTEAETTSPLTQVSTGCGPDADFWWTSTGTVLGLMMQKAGYSTESLENHISFFRQSVAPAMGKSPCLNGTPHGWTSFMTDDFTPVEFSWCWKEGKPLPAVRYAVEPIARRTGIASDPLNFHTAKELICSSKQYCSGVDLDWLKQCWMELLVSDHACKKTDNSDDGSQIFLAWDLQKNGASLKSYFLPNLKAKQTGQSKMQVIQKCMDRLCISQPSMTEAFTAFSSYMGCRVGEDELSVEIAAVDCVKSSSSRFKIYVRCRQTTFDSVSDIMTMSGLLDSEKMQTAIASLRELWALVLGLPADFDTTVPLPSRGHRTAGILYYFEFKPGEGLPSVKVYIPVKHYGINDLEVAKGLSKFLDARGNRLADGGYIEAMQEIL